MSVEDSTKRCDFVPIQPCGQKDALGSASKLAESKGWSGDTKGISIDERIERLVADIKVAKEDVKTKWNCTWKVEYDGKYCTDGYKAARAKLVEAKRTLRQAETELDTLKQKKASGVTHIIENTSHSTTDEQKVFDEFLEQLYGHNVISGNFQDELSQNEPGNENYQAVIMSLHKSMKTYTQIWGEIQSRIATAQCLTQLIKVAQKALKDTQSNLSYTRYELERFQLKSAPTQDDFQTIQRGVDSIAWIEEPYEKLLLQILATLENKLKMQNSKEKPLSTSQLSKSNGASENHRREDIDELIQEAYNANRQMLAQLQAHLSTLNEASEEWVECQRQIHVVQEAWQSLATP